MTSSHASHPTVRVGSMISEFAVPGIVPLSKRVGLDFSILDAEHGSFDLGTIATLAAIARGHSYDLYVRIPIITKAYIGPILDAGVAGIVTPMVETGEQARELVRLTRYAPLGERGISLTRAHSGYKVSNVSEYLEHANSHVKIYAQIESTAGLGNLSEIAATRGLSGLLLGPNDLLASLGTPGDYGNETLSSSIDAIASVCKQHGISSGIITAKEALLKRAVGAGMDLASVDSDLGYFITGAHSAIDGFRSMLGGTP